MASRGKSKRILTEDKTTGSAVKPRQSIVRYMSEREKVLDKRNTGFIKAFVPIIIAVFILMFITLSVPLVGLEVDLGEQGSMLGDVEKTMSINGFNVFNAFGNPKKDTFDYIVGSIEALQKAVSLGQGNLIYGAVTNSQRELLDFAFMAIGVISLTIIAVSLSSLITAVVGMAKKKDFRKPIYMLAFLQFILSFILFVITVVMQGESNASLLISIGVGMWFNILVNIGLCVFAVFDLINSAKLNKEKKGIA